jgi:hypothetical protein
VDPFLGCDREIDDRTTAVATQRPADKRGMVFSTLSAKQQLDRATEERGFLRGPLGIS